MPGLGLCTVDSLQFSAGATPAADRCEGNHDGALGCLAPVFATFNRARSYCPCAGSTLMSHTHNTAVHPAATAIHTTLSAAIVQEVVAVQGRHAMASTLVLASRLSVANGYNSPFRSSHAVMLLNNKNKTVNKLAKQIFLGSGAKLETWSKEQLSWLANRWARWGSSRCWTSIKLSCGGARPRGCTYACMTYTWREVQAISQPPKKVTRAGY